MSQGDVIYKERGVFPIYKDDLTTVYSSLTNTVAPPFPESTLAFIYDVYGYRQFNFRQNQQGSTLVLGGCYSRAKDLGRAVSASALNSTSVVVASTASFGTAGKFTNAFFVVQDDNGGAGAAPEGESSTVLSHTNTQLNLDPNLPLSTAIGTGDLISVISPKVVNSAANDSAVLVAGLAVTTITNLDWGWFQHMGTFPRAKHSAGAVATQTALIAGAAVLVTFGTATAVVGGTAPAGAGYIVGYQIDLHAADNASTESPVCMTLVPTVV
jgi:hypothetical protein